MKGMDIAFLILHYVVTELTCDAVEHIERNCDTEDYRIVIVDNASPNESFRELTRLYKDDSHVLLIKNEKNLGFAKGNNEGLKIIKDQLHPEFVVMLNNDVELLDKGLLKKLRKEYSESAFYIAGPRVELPDGVMTSNPFKLFIPTIKWLDYMIQKRKEEIFWSRMGLYEKVCPFLRGKLYKILHIFEPPQVPYAVIDNNKKPYEQRIYDVALSGCCLVFSGKFMEEYGLLDESTFLGGEELLLYLNMIGSGKRMVYLPDIHIKHLESRSTKATEKKKGNERRCRDFRRSKEVYQIAKKHIIKYKEERGKEVAESVNSMTDFKWKKYDG